MALVVSLQRIVSSSRVFCQPTGALVRAWGPEEPSDSQKARQGLLSPHREKHGAALPDNLWCGGGTPCTSEGRLSSGTSHRTVPHGSTHCMVLLGEDSIPLHPMSCTRGERQHVRLVLILALLGTPRGSSLMTPMSSRHHTISPGNRCDTSVPASL